ncbi:O-antigen ligase [Mycolicibacterium sp. F2034L]|uniref:O-antigen ligase family protein n=1 Tax=Mycolicibacterium sp. F2034L TaxID=2926422 RepID=UPI001FF68FD2|nr:O-antigen ligase family protein [Mycolicibacterium sp. F2034L]MCK0173780.1 O-antigen ligase family protein [Mycolicibacterium sp. F2034L]
MIVSLAAIAIVFLVAFVVPHRVRLLIAALLVVPQLDTPGLPLTVALLWTILTCVLGLLSRGRSRADSPVLTVASLFVIVSVVSLLWALPSGQEEAYISISRGVVFVLWLREMIVVARDDPEFVDKITLWMVPGIVLQSVLSILFRLNPNLEEQFLRSKVAAITVGPSAEALYIDAPNNVLDPAKAGGFFVNGNVASMFGAIAALVLLTAARRTGRRWVYLVAGLAILGSIATGSKTAIFLAMGCALALLFAPRVSKGGALLGVVLAGVAVVASLSIVDEIVQRVAPDFHSATDVSLDTRTELWAVALRVLSESPFFGLGFGGWAEEVGLSLGNAGFRGSVAYAPHNFILDAWVNSGIAAAVLSVVYIGVAVSFGLRVIRQQQSARDARTAMLCLCAALWASIHGLGDNSGAWGDHRTAMVVAMAFAYLYVMASDPKPTAAEHNRASQSKPASR